jgi:hypothetical protein
MSAYQLHEIHFDPPSFPLVFNGDPEAPSRHRSSVSPSATLLIQVRSPLETATAVGRQPMHLEAQVRSVF